LLPDHVTEDPQLRARTQRHDLVRRHLPPNVREHRLAVALDVEAFRVDQRAVQVQQDDGAPSISGHRCFPYERRTGSRRMPTRRATHTIRAKNRGAERPPPPSPPPPRPAPTGPTPPRPP